MRCRHPIFFFLLLAACLPASVPPASSGGQQVDPTSADLGVDDVLEIRVFGVDELSAEYRVDESGTVAFPLLGPIPAAGSTAAELSEKIRAALADGYLREPHVTVTIVEFNSRKISVIGEVKNPGRFPWRDGLTLVQAIAEAGGTTPSAALAAVQITRTGTERKQFSVPFHDITLGRSPDFLLLAGDVVFVQESAVK